MGNELHFDVVDETVLFESGTRILIRVDHIGTSVLRRQS